MPLLPYTAADMMLLGGSLSNAELHKEITGRTSLEVPQSTRIPLQATTTRFRPLTGLNGLMCSKSCSISPLLVRARSRCIDRMRMPTIILWLRNR